MKLFLTVAVSALLLSACTTNTSNSMDDLTKPDDIIKEGEKFCSAYKKKQQNFLSQNKHLLPKIKKAEAHIEKLANYFYSEGKNSKKVFNELNDLGSPKDGTVGEDLMNVITTDGGHLTCISEGVVAVDSNPKNIGKYAKNLLKTVNNKPLLNHLIKEMRASCGEEKVITSANLPVKITSLKTLDLKEKHVLVAYGRNPMLREKLNKEKEGKFMCYVSYPASNN